MSEHRGSLSKAIGNVKRKYSQDGFNPFAAIEFAFNNCMATGAGTKILFLGWSERFQDDTIRALNHVMFDRKMIGGDDKPVAPIAGDVDLEGGITLRFQGIKDHWEHQARFLEEIKQASVVILCDPYGTPDMRNVIREQAASKHIYDASKNNAG